MSETEMINSTRLDLFSGPGTTRLVATIAERKRSQSRKRRTVAVVAGASGQGAHVKAPADFAEAVAEVDSCRQHTVRLSYETLAEFENEKIGEEVSRTPFLY